MVLQKVVAPVAEELAETTTASVSQDTEINRGNALVKDKERRLSRLGPHGHVERLRKYRKIVLAASDLSTADVLWCAHQALQIQEDNKQSYVLISCLLADAGGSTILSDKFSRLTLDLEPLVDQELVTFDGSLRERRLRSTLRALSLRGS